MMFDIRGKLNI